MKNISSATVYLGSSAKGPETHKSATIQLGKRLAAKNIKLIYGGMNAGLMFLVAESCIQSGGFVQGIIPAKLKDNERTKRDLNELIIVDDLWERKRKLFEHGDVIFALPGGYGTIDETIEALYWAELGLHTKPIVFLDIGGYWTHLLDFLENNVQPMPHAPYNFKDFLIRAASVDDAFEKLGQWHAPKDLTPPDHPHLPHFEAEILANPDEPYLISECRIDDVYRLSAAVTLRQLGAHHRPIAILNQDGHFTDFEKWALFAQKNNYLTPQCLDLFCIESDMNTLQEKIKHCRHSTIEIDLHEKWGDKPENDLTSYE